MSQDKKRQYVHIDSFSEVSFRQQVFRLLEKNSILKPKQICILMDLDHKKHGHTVSEYKRQWKRQYKFRQGLKCLNFHNARGWIYALKSVNRESVGIGWIRTSARNGMYVWKDAVLGRLEWHRTGRINIWVKRPATWGRVKQLLANAFFKTGLVYDLDLFNLWSDTARFKGAHLVYDTGERLPYARVDFLKRDLGVVVKLGDVTHPTSLEIEFCYPNFAEKNELLIRQFSGFLKDMAGNNGDSGKSHEGNGNGKNGKRGYIA